MTVRNDTCPKRSCGSIRFAGLVVLAVFLTSCCVTNRDGESTAVFDHRKMDELSTVDVTVGRSDSISIHGRQNGKDALAYLSSLELSRVRIREWAPPTSFFQGLAKACPELEELRVSDAGSMERQITDGALEALADLPRLRVLEFEDVVTEFSHTGLQHLAARHTLETLTLWGCGPLSDKAFEELASLPRLTELNNDCVDVPGDGFARICDKGDLTVLRIGADKIDPKHFQSVAKLINLKVLHVHGGFHDTFRLSDDDLSTVLRATPRLRSLKVTNMLELGSDWLVSAARLKHLSHLDYFGFGALERQHVQELFRTTPLRTLKLEGNRIAADALTDISECATLTSLSIWCTQGHTAHVSSLSGADSIRTLTLDCPFAEEETSKAAKELMGMKHLKLLRIPRSGFSSQQKSELTLSLADTLVLE